MTYQDYIPVLESFCDLTTDEIIKLVEANVAYQTPLFKAMLLVYIGESADNEKWDGLTNFSDTLLEDFDTTLLQSYFDVPLAKTHCLTVERLADLILKLNNVCLAMDTERPTFQSYIATKPVVSMNNGVHSQLELSKIGTTLYTSALDISKTTDGVYKILEFIDIPYHQGLEPTWGARFYDYALKFSPDEYKRTLTDAGVNLNTVSIAWLARLLRTDKLTDKVESPIIFKHLETLTGIPESKLKEQTFLLKNLMPGAHHVEVATMVHVNCRLKDNDCVPAPLPDLNLQY